MLENYKQTKEQTLIIVSVCQQTTSVHKAQGDKYLI